MHRGWMEGAFPGWFSLQYVSLSQGQRSGQQPIVETWCTVEQPCHIYMLLVEFCTRNQCSSLCRCVVVCILRHSDWNLTVYTYTPNISIAPDGMCFGAVPQSVFFQFTYVVGRGGHCLRKNRFTGGSSLRIMRLRVTGSPDTWRTGRFMTSSNRSTGHGIEPAVPPVTA